MSPQFHIDLGPFSFSLETDSTGISLRRGPVEKTFAWDVITGALLVRPKEGDLREEEEQLAKAERFLGGASIEKLKGLHGAMATIHIGYRDERNRLRHEQIPVPMADDSFLQEFRAHLGKRWLGEAPDQHAAKKRLHTAPGFFKTVFYLFLILGAIVAIAAFGLYSLAAPALNFLSLRQMYFEVESGDYAGFGMHVFLYATLFIFAYMLRRLWRSRREAKQRRMAPPLR
jgi:hypothetical protein